MLLVDSSVWIAYFNGLNCWQTETLDRLLQQIPVYIGDLILTEVLQGFRHDRDFHKARKALSHLTCLELGGYEVALQSAKNYRLLRRRGITPRKTIDIVIATYCIINDLPLLHKDRDFNPITEFLDLKTVSPDFYRRPAPTNHG